LAGHACYLKIFIKKQWQLTGFLCHKNFEPQRLEGSNEIHCVNFDIATETPKH
jgi:hypothetical protein